MCGVRIALLVFLLTSFLHDYVLTANSQVNRVLQQCFTDVDCNNLENATCVKSTCMCNGTRICNVKVNKVVNKLGEKCEINEECNIESAECKKYKCECKDGYIKSTDGRKCLIVSEGIYGSCEDSVQCYTKIPNSICRSNQCVCDGMHEHKGYCFKNIELGQICESDPECLISNNAKCVNSICTCNEDYVASMNGSICLLAAIGNNSPCIDNAQCTKTLGEYSHCVDGTCICKELYHYKDKPINKCIQDLLLGDKCELHSDCHDPYPEKENRLECIEGVCKCRSFLKETNGICLDTDNSSGSKISIYLYTQFLILIIITSNFS